MLANNSNNSQSLYPTSSMSNTALSAFHVIYWGRSYYLQFIDEETKEQID